MDYTVQVDETEATVRVKLIEVGTFEASGAVDGLTLVVRGTSVDDALARFQKSAEEQRARQQGS